MKKENGVSSQLIHVISYLFQTTCAVPYSHVHRLCALVKSSSIARRRIHLFISSSLHSSLSQPAHLHNRTLRMNARIPVVFLLLVIFVCGKAKNEQASLHITSAQASGRWHGFVSLGGRVSSSASISHCSKGRWDVYVRGTDSQLYRTSFRGGSWSRYQALGGGLSSAPSSTSTNSCHQYVAILGFNSKIYLRKWVGRWFNFVPIGDVQWYSKPVIVSSRNRVDVFVKGSNNRLYHLTQTAGVWATWKVIASGITSAPAVVSRFPGEFDVVAKRGDDAIWWTHFNGIAWSPWVSLGGRVPSSDPAITALGHNRLDVFAKGMDHALWTTSYTGGAWASPWTRIGGRILFSPHAASDGHGKIQVVVVGSNSEVYSNTYS